MRKAARLAESGCQADAPAPKNSYFQIRKNFPLDLTLEVPLGMVK